MTGHGNVVFSHSDAENLRRYLLAGGFLHIDDNYGMDVFVRPAMKKVFPELSFIELPFEHQIYDQNYDFPNGLPLNHDIEIYVESRGLNLRPNLHKHFFDHLTMHIRKPITATLMSKVQPLMVDPQKMQHSRLKIMHMHRIFDDIITEITCFTISDPRLNSSTSQPVSKTSGVVIPAVCFFGQRTLTIDRSSKLGAPNNQGLIQ